MSDKVAMPKDGYIYDYMWDKQKKEWIKWTDIV